MMIFICRIIHIVQRIVHTAQRFLLHCQSFNSNMLSLEANKLGWQEEEMSKCVGRCCLLSRMMDAQSLEIFITKEKVN